jgi:hypothetical protein
LRVRGAKRDAGVLATGVFGNLKLIGVVFRSGSLFGIGPSRFWQVAWRSPGLVPVTILELAKLRIQPRDQADQERDVAARSSSASIRPTVRRVVIANAASPVIASNATISNVSADNELDPAPHRRTLRGSRTLKMFARPGCPRLCHRAREAPR